MLKQRLSPFVAAVVIAVIVLIIVGAYLLLFHRHAPEQEAPPIANDPYAGQISGPPTKSSTEPAVAP